MVCQITAVIIVNILILLVLLLLETQLSVQNVFFINLISTFTIFHDVSIIQKSFVVLPTDFCLFSFLPKYIHFICRLSGSFRRMVIFDLLIFFSFFHCVVVPSSPLHFFWNQNVVDTYNIHKTPVDMPITNVIM